MSGTAPHRSSGVTSSDGSGMFRRGSRAVVLGLLTWFLAASSAATIRVQDDEGIDVQLQAPARRIVSLAPHITELLFAAGAGNRIIATTQFSDYPAEARSIPRVSNSSMLDFERIVLLKPDLIIVWTHGTPQSQLERLAGLGIPLFHVNARRLTDIARQLLQIGALAATEEQANVAAREFMQRLDALRAHWADQRPVRVFWQVWSRPLLTVNGRHLLSDALELCGGRNVFAGLAPLVPSVSVESVVNADPDAIVTTTTDAAGDGGDGLDTWRALRHLRATRENGLVVLDADTIHRPSPRMLEGVAELCRKLDVVRRREAP